LDGLRGVAALAVVLLHTLQLFDFHFRAHVALAVDFFFVLSGFVVAKAYEDKLKQSMAFSKFVKLRLVRLYPLIFVGVLMGALVLTLRFLGKDPYSARQLTTVLLAGLLLLPTTALGRGDIYPADTPCWSLFFELVINFAYALVVRWLDTRRLVFICGVAVVALAFAARMNQGLDDMGFLAANFWMGFIRVTYPFAVGVLLFRWRRLRAISGATSMILALLLVGVLFLPQWEANWVYDCITVVFFFPAIVFCGAGFTKSPVFNSICLGLGELSYPLYITHYPLVRIISNAVKILHLHIAPTAVVLFSMLASILLSLSLLKVWDRPVRSWLTASVIPRRAAVPVSAPSELS
jgi:peptidoglycan/LPS O-acetylase OafA/YrhL